MWAGFTRVLWHYSHAFNFRMFLFMETQHLIRSGRRIPSWLIKMIWRQPSEAEDWVNLLCFLDTEETILLFDIGANVGDWASGFRRLFSDTRIIAFEPGRNAYQKLCQTGNAIGNIDVHHVAISDYVGEMEMYVPEDSRLTSSVAYNDVVNTFRNMGLENREKVLVQRLDTYKDRIVNDVDKVVVKIDVQGAELSVLRGGQGCFGKGRCRSM